MKSLHIALIVGLLSASATAHAVTVEVYGKCHRQVAADRVRSYPNMTVNEATVAVLAKKGIVPVNNKKNDYIVGIGDASDGNDTVDGVNRAWGWDCRFSDGDPTRDEELLVSPMEKVIPEIKPGVPKMIIWTYGYLVMNPACQATGNCKWVDASPEDCEPRLQSKDLIPADTQISVPAASEQQAPAAEQSEEVPAPAVQNN